MYLETGNYHTKYLWLFLTDISIGGFSCHSTERKTCNYGKATILKFYRTLHSHGLVDRHCSAQKL